MTEIKPLTSLRGIAAVMVLIYHVRLINDWYFWLDDFTNIFARGYLWVDFFFILSGFILAYVYGPQFDRRFGRDDYLNFLRKRLLRIYPLHFVTLIMFVPIVGHQLWIGTAALPAQTYVTTFVEHLFLVQSWYHHYLLVWNVPSWSISSEWAAYLLFPAFFYLMHRRSITLAAGLVVVGVGCVYVMSMFSTRQNLDILNAFGTLRCFAEFCLGILVHRVYQKYGDDVAAFGHDIVAGMVVVTIFLLLHSPLHDIWLVPAFGALILAAALNQGRFKTLLETPIPYFLGLISYSLYMNHWLVFRVASGVRNRLFGDAADPLALTVLMVGALIVTVLVSMLTYRHVEQRFRRGLWPRATPARPEPQRQF